MVRLQVRWAGAMALAAAIAVAAVAADQRSEEVVARFLKAATAAKGCRGEFDVTYTTPGRTSKTTYSYRLLHPNFGDIRFSTPAGKELGQLRSDGRHTWSVTHDPGEYVRSDSGPAGETLALAAGPFSPIQAFLMPRRYLSFGERKHVGEETLGTEPCTVVETKTRRAGETARIWFDRGGWPRKVELRGPGERTVSMAVRSYQVDDALTPARFTYRPPDDYGDRTARVTARSGLAVGSPAPEVTFSLVNGERVALARLKGKSPVLLYFCLIGSKSTTRDLPVLEKLQADTGEAAAVLVVHGGPDTADLRARLAVARTRLTVALSDPKDPPAPKFRTTVLPNWVILDRAGNIAWQATGDASAEARKKLMVLAGLPGAEQP